jgi:hypothetical protein
VGEAEGLPAAGQDSGCQLRSVMNRFESLVLFKNHNTISGDSAFFSEGFTSILGPHAKAGKRQKCGLVSAFGDLSLHQSKQHILNNERKCRSSPDLNSSTRTLTVSLYLIPENPSDQAGQPKEANPPKYP